MITVGAYEAKTKLPHFLRTIESRKEEIIITRFGHAIAKIVPITDEELETVQVISAIKALRNKIKPGKLDV